MYAKSIRGLDALATATIEIDGDTVQITFDDDHTRCLELDGARVEVADAACQLRFVRLATVVTSAETIEFITPPAKGAIAPRAARIPTAPAGSVVISTTAFASIVTWIQTSGRLHGHTMAELANLACIATPQLAVAIGTSAGQVAVGHGWPPGGPHRGGSDPGHILRPLAWAARRSHRAAQAFTAATLQSATQVKIL